jgi:hypothetical protein
MRGTYGRKTSSDQTTSGLVTRGNVCPPIAFAFDEGTIDEMLGYKLANNFGDAGRHRHRFDQVVSGVTKSFAFSRVRRDCQKLVEYRRTQGDPRPGSER